MQFKTFSSFIKDVIAEGDRLQKTDIDGRVITTKKYTQTQKIGFLLSVGLLFVIHDGFSDEFAGYIISFLSIFIGLFATIVISLFDKSNTLKEKLVEENLARENNTANYNEIARLKKKKNYLIQFTGLTSYAIYIAICIIILLLFTLLHDLFKENITSYHAIKNWSEINLCTTWNFNFL
jgi:hypothetical protein